MVPLCQAPALPAASGVLAWKAPGLQQSNHSPSLGEEEKATCQTAKSYSSQIQRMRTRPSNPPVHFLVSWPCVSAQMTSSHPFFCPPFSHPFSPFPNCTLHPPTFLGLHAFCNLLSCTMSFPLQRIILSAYKQVLEFPIKKKKTPKPSLRESNIYPVFLGGAAAHSYLMKESFSL